MPPKRQRVRPDKTVEIGSARVTNKTANSIVVSVAGDGTVQVMDCCLEEQGK
jgi:hypothetical protein